jgi:molybdate transport system substrate-binding protein
VIRLGLLCAVAALALAACGDSRPALTVSAAASLMKPFSAYGDRLRGADVRYSFAGSDQLAAQIRAGLKPDVFAAANTKLPQALHASRLVGQPTVFAANRLVIAVRAGSSKVRSLADLERPGVSLAIGTATVPVGDYTRIVLARLPRAAAAKIAANVRSDEPDVNGIVGKLTQRAIDAGFLYATDVAATRGALVALPLPPELGPTVAYAAAVVAGARHPREARAFIAGLLAGEGARELRAAGFLPPPR